MREEVPDPTPSTSPTQGAHAAAPDEAVTGRPPLVDRQQIINQIGGLRGLIDSGLPVIVFITVNAFASLSVAVWSALGAGAVLFAVRLARRENVQQSISGFLGVAIAAFIAGQTGQARDFFLPALWSTSAFGLAFLISAMVRWPLVGVMAELFWPTPGLKDAKAWRSHRCLMRAYTWLTLLWAGVYLLRIAVQGSLYLANEVTLLGTTKLVMGWPLTALEALATVYVVRRVRQRISSVESSSLPA
ncbi:MAG: DUF3159 domain-containing protein [Geodermatophilaceae bacterium]